MDTAEKISIEQRVVQFESARRIGKAIVGLEQQEQALKDTRRELCAQDLEMPEDSAIFMRPIDQEVGLVVQRYRKDIEHWWPLFSGNPPNVSIEGLGYGPLGYTFLAHSMRYEEFTGKIWGYSPSNDLRIELTDNIDATIWDDLSPGGD